MKFIRNIIKPQDKEDEEFYVALKKLLGFRPKNINYYKTAFIHRSIKVLDENGNPINYERMEFLGDAMLGSVIAAFLFKTVPDGNEGYLTQMRSKIVSRNQLNTLGKELDLIRFVKSTISKNRMGQNIYGNIFEALIGAIYLDRGYRYCEKFIDKRVINAFVDIPSLENKITSYKGLIIEWCQKTKKNLEFQTYEDSGNENIRHYSVKLVIDGKVISKGRSTSKKKAEEIASKRIYFVYQDEIKNML
ncbi:ribonuclease III [Flavicella sp.]|uniref:ribonuclease III n=1 Tax=Flavicella sp. TaxID=2957742 RepID=UPI0026169296|nr:ribonuclease III [Flavicella sp.]MDG1805015.1 ribonuclease III [Flavicella sp.]MDG2281091.1 ribonuclease III [Flavicella sp.]